MDTQPNNLLEKIRETNLKSFIYPSITAVVLVVTIVIIVMSINFLLVNFNKISSIDITSSNSEIDTEKYALIAKKLGIQNISEEPPTETPAPKSDPEISVIPPSLDKNLLSISIVNANGEEGLAGKLKAIFVLEGFTVTNIKNAPTQKDTEIQLKKSKMEYLLLVEPVIKKSYPNATSTELSETAKYDLIVIIGKK